MPEERKLVPWNGTAELKWTRYTPLGSVALFKVKIWLFHHKDRIQIGRVMVHP